MFIWELWVYLTLIISKNLKGTQPQIWLKMLYNSLE
ncbi:MAG: hypothetical protein ACD_19C00395G0002 [uncultured bacterium]|nr:MAG: hypothetical protein ACD_19C00395G0002 [uncultured bacterium]